MREPLTLNEIHSVTIEVIKKIMEVCQNNDIDYFVTYGSLIGAVRHKGFIPWDDDFDIGMLRPNFERFCNYCHEHEKELYPFKLMDRSNTENYPFNIPRFTDLRYEMESSIIPNVGMGVFIDIYPFDGIGNNAERAKKKLNWRMALFMSAIDYQGKGYYTPSKKNMAYSVIRYFVYLWSKMKPRKYFLDKMMSLGDRFSENIDSSDYVGCIIWDAEIRPKKKEWCSETVDAPFEELTVKIPRGYDLFLKAGYGDYMQLPPEEKRVPTHEYKVFRKQDVIS